MQNVLLASTLHDPQGVLLDPLKQTAAVVLSNYRSWVFNITTTTDPRVKELLISQEERGVYITEPDPAKPIVSNKIENDHLNALRKALAVAEKLGINKIQYTDWDRIIVAAIHFPKDLNHMAYLAAKLTGGTKAYLNFRRSPEDYFTHPPPLVQTELEFNRLYSKAFGMPIDIGSTAHAMSLDVLQKVIRKSPDMEGIDFPHPKWLIIAKEAGAKITSVETHHVLTFETPEQFKTQVNKDTAEGKGNYSLLQQAFMATIGIESVKNPKEWELRFATERQYLTLLQNHLDVFGFSNERKTELQSELGRSLSHLEGRQKAILEALGQSANGVER